MYRRISAILLVIAAFFAVNAVSAPANAAGAEDFGLTCNLSASYQARVDMQDVYITQGGSKVDSSEVWWRAISRSTGNQSSIRAQRVEIQLYNASSAGPGPQWVIWTYKGGTATDGTTVASGTKWDPSAKLDLNAAYTQIRMKAWYNGVSCTSAARAR